MKINISQSVKKGILENMVKNDIEKFESHGIIFSTEKNKNSVPTGFLLKSGKEIYIQA